MPDRMYGAALGAAIGIGFSGSSVGCLMYGCWLASLLPNSAATPRFCCWICVPLYAKFRSVTKSNAACCR